MLLYYPLMVCVKCGSELSGKQEKYCSVRCQKLYLKSQYRKRKREQLNEYKQDYKARRKANDGKPLGQIDWS